MPHLNVYVHFVWTTKNKTPLLHTTDLRQIMWTHIRENALKKSIHLDFIGGYHDHCHCLISLGGDQKMSDMMRLIKGESAFWMNQQRLIGSRFAWQEEYYACSVSPHGVSTVRDYIKNQEEHHRVTSFQEEYLTLMSEFGFKQFV
jgi:REP element-mobilizing transposase RayT